MPRTLSRRWFPLLPASISTMRIFLGHSLREIASEKAGILKPTVPVVLAEQRAEAREVVLARAAKLGCPVVATATAYPVAGESIRDGRVQSRLTEVASGCTVDVAPSLPG